MNNIEIKKIEVTEIEQLQIIGKQTFFETFAEVNTDENMQKYLNEVFSLNKLESELSNQNSEFYFAIIENKVIGYLKLNQGQAQTESKDANGLEIERIYILKEFQRQNAGQALFNKAYQIAEKSKSDFIWLGVWEKNLKAINFYKKNGFVEFGNHIFKLGLDEQIDILMKLKLQ